jgi:hypothetical protein
VSSARYELGFYIPEDGILHYHPRENLKSYVVLTGWALYQRRNESPVRYELGFYIPEDGIGYGGGYEECRLLGYRTPVLTAQETHYVSATGPSRLMLCKI